MVRTLVALVSTLLLPGVAHAACGAGPVVLNELMVDPSGADSGAEWVELLLPAGPDVDVSGWTVERALQPGSWTTVFTVPAGTTVAAGEPLTLAGPVAAATLPASVLVLTAQADMGNASTGSDAVRLLDCTGAVVDVVVYGSANASGQVFQDEAGADVPDASLAPKPSTGKALARIPDGADTGVGHADLFVRDGTPDALNAPGGGGGTCAPGAIGNVLLDELLPDPAGADGGAEWVELLGTGVIPTDVGGWRIERATQPGSFSTVFTLPYGTTIAPGQHLVVAGPSAVVPADALLLPSTADLGNATTDADAVRLVDCGGVAMDVVAYGAVNPAGASFLDEHVVAIEDARLAPKPTVGTALARVPDGIDTDDGHADFVLQGPTPGASNDPPVDTGHTDVVADTDVVVDTVVAHTDPPVDTAGATDVAADTSSQRTCDPHGARDVVLNELVVDPVGADAGAEWIELLAVAPTNVSRWRVEASLTPGVWTTVFELPVHTQLAAGGRLVVAGPAATVTGALVLTPGTTLGNASTSSDAVRLVDCAGAVVDVVVYGAANATGEVFPDEDGADVLDARLAPKPTSGTALARFPDGQDTGDGHADFVRQAPTPDASNGVPDTDVPVDTDTDVSVDSDTDAAPTCSLASAARVVLNELVPDPSGADSGAEWVELLVDAGTLGPVDLTGWRVERALQPTAWTAVFTLPSTTVVPGDRLVLAGPSASVSGAIVLAPGTDLGNATTGSDAVRLVDCVGTVVDVVVYGAANAAGQVFTDEGGADVADDRLAPKPSSAKALARVPDGADSDDGKADFLLQDVTPGVTNDLPVDTDVDTVVDTAAPLCVATAGVGGVVLNEIVADPAGADGQAEWVELRSLLSSPTDLAGWRVESATSPGSWKVVFTVPDATVLAGGDRLVLGGTSTALGTGLVLSAGVDLGNAGTSSDAVRLVACDGAVIDLVVYGAANGVDQVFTDEHGVDVLDARLAPKPRSGEALARVPDGHDTDDGPVDFVSQIPTPGASNDVGPGPSTCDDGLPGDVLLDEIMVDPDGADALAEWVEVLSASAAALDVSGWRVERGTSPTTWATVFELPDGTTLQAGERLLLAGPAAVVPDGALVLDALTEIGNATTGSDAVRLVDCTGAVVDLVAYGDANTAGEVFLDEHGAAIGDDRLAPRPGSGESLARSPDGGDSDDGAADFVLADPPTPGAENVEVACAVSTGGVFVNELMPDAQGADGAAGTEFVELFSAAEATVDLSGWSVVVYGSPGSERLRVRLPAGTTIAPGDFLVVGGLASGADVVVDGLDLGSGSGGDAVVLEDCAGTRVDGVVYGGTNADGLAEDDGSVPAEGAGDPREGQCVARAVDGRDGDASAEDFVVTSVCTPGETNELTGELPTDEPVGPVGCGCGGSGEAPTGEAPTARARVADGSCATAPWPRLPVGLLALLVVGFRRRTRSGWSSEARPE